MDRRKEYIAVERERIAELLEKIDDLAVLGSVYHFVSYCLSKRNRKGGAA